MKLGIPNAMLYHRYPTLFRTFLDTLGCEYLVGTDTNHAILQKGTKLAIDESCVPFTLYLGQVATLVKQCDAIFVFRIEQLQKNAEVCVRFHAIYDIVRTTFPHVPLVCLHLGEGLIYRQATAFVKLGVSLGFSAPKSLVAYHAAQKADKFERNNQRYLISQTLAKSDRIKILLLGQSYILRDNLLCGGILNILRTLGVDVILSDCFDSKQCIKAAKQFTPGLYWMYNQEMVGAALLAQNHVDGIMALTAFPCGADALVNELLLRRIKSPPFIHIVMDQLAGEAGIETRLESFVDLITHRSHAKKQENDQSNEKSSHQLSTHRHLPHSH